MSANRTIFTGADPAQFLAAVTPQARRDDAMALDAMFRRATGYRPQMFGATIIGYGSYAYRYDSGHGGESIAAGFSPRKSALVIYNIGSGGRLAGNLGIYEAGKGCLYIKKLSDIDLGVLQEMVVTGMEDLRKLWPVTPS
jgi:hypothetical protein